MIHFVGLRGEAYDAAVKVWGEPDVIWSFPAWATIGDVAREDVIVFGVNSVIVPPKVSVRVRDHIRKRAKSNGGT